MGCIGMRLEDFCLCTPSEFWKVYEVWREGRDLSLRESWEQTRVLCASFLQPYSKKRLTGKDVFPLPWDDKQEEKEEESEEERRARYEAAKKRYGIG